jgi:hypothetical protein
MLILSLENRESQPRSHAPLLTAILVIIAALIIYSILGG